MAEKKFPYFRVSNWTKEDLSEWYNHFTDLKIPCCITKDTNTLEYALWRVGDEAGLMPNGEKLIGTVIEQYGVNWTAFTLE